MAASGAKRTFACRSIDVREGEPAVTICASADVFALVVDSSVEVRLVDQPIAFVLATRGADDAAVLVPGDLAGDGACGPDGVLWRPILSHYPHRSGSLHQLQGEQRS